MLTSSVRYVGPPPTPKERVDSNDLLSQIRTLSEQDDSPLAVLVRQLDEHLTAAGGLPDPWIHPDYDNWGEDA